MISSTPIQSHKEPGELCLKLELLFTAPRNRQELRSDGKPYLIGVGTQMLLWAAWFSREQGYKGRLLLDASPDFVKWYERKRLQKLDLKPIVFEGVAYTPMELTETAAQELLSAWEERG